jgi:hypothetical protein
VLVVLNVIDVKSRGSLSDAFGVTLVFEESPLSGVATYTALLSLTATTLLDRPRRQSRHQIDGMYPAGIGEGGLGALQVAMYWSVGAGTLELTAVCEPALADECDVSLCGVEESDFAVAFVRATVDVWRANAKPPSGGEDGSGFFDVYFNLEAAQPVRNAKNSSITGGTMTLRANVRTGAFMINSLFISGEHIVCDIFCI